MAKQRLGPKKHARCESVTGRKYRSCYVRGGWEHFNAECWWEDGKNADDVNWKAGTWTPGIRNGQFVNLRPSNRLEEVAPNGTPSAPLPETDIGPSARIHPQFW